MAVAGRAGRIQPARLDGLTEAKAALADLPEAFRLVIAETIDTGSAIIESEAHGRVPYDEGDLDRSIGRNIREDGLEAAVGSNLIYANFVEFGTSDTPAQPWLYPAYRTGAKYVRKQMRDWAKGVGKRVVSRTKRSKKLRKPKA